MIRLQVQQLVKSYRNAKTAAVAGVCFNVLEGQLLALVGESGSGKTTLLRLIAGLEHPDDGTITLDEKPLSSPSRVVPPEQRGIGLVFQHHALFPHLTVFQNIVFGLRDKSRPEKSDVAARMLELVGLADFAKRYPHQLSGGERQRVALARALAPGPRLLLLDEPFSSLDARLRQSVRDETRAILKEQGTTALFVTHDTGDALSIADQIVVLKNGTVQQSGTAAEVYHSPANRHVASFFGTCNYLPSLPGMTDTLRHIGPPASGIWVRPEDLELVPPETPAAFAGVVSKVNFHGAFQEVELHCAGVDPFQLTVRHQAAAPVHTGETWGIAAKDRGH